MRARTGLAVALAALVACSGGSDRAAPTTAAPSTTTVTTTTTTTLPPTTTTEPPRTPQELTGDFGASLARVTNEYGTSTGLVVEVDDQRFVVAPAHLVAPLASASVSPATGSLGTEAVVLPVAAVDFDVDLALVGPLPRSASSALVPVDLDDIADVSAGATITMLTARPGVDAVQSRSAVIADVRTFRELDATIVQASLSDDAPERDGILVTDRRQFVGMTILSLDDRFVAALSATDVANRVTTLAAEAGPLTHAVFPTEANADTGTATIPSALVAVDLVGLPVDVERTVTLRVAATAPVGVEVLGSTYQRSSNLTPRVAALSGQSNQDISLDTPPEEFLTQTAAGTYQFVLGANERPTIRLTRVAGDGPLDVEYTSSIPVAVVVDPDGEQPIALDSPIAAAIEPLEWADVYTVSLVAGQDVRMSAAALVGDLHLTVLPPGQSQATVESFYLDDSIGGLNGLDPSGVFTAPVDGVYRIVIGDHAGGSGYRFTVESVRTPPTTTAPPTTAAPGALSTNAPSTDAPPGTDPAGA
jgi:hypothetical protein